MSDNKVKKSSAGGLDRALFREWLEKLQQESWQLELIISGFVLYGVYHSRGAITHLEQYNDMMSNNVFMESLETLFTIGWRIFFINLLLHVILRSLWIGAIGLRYVSGEIDYERLNYSNYFTEYLQKKVGDYDDFIEKLEKICSVLFSYTFLLFLFFVSALLFGIVMIMPIIIGKWLGMEFTSTILFFVIIFFPYCLGGLIVFADFVTLGGLRRVKDNTFSRIYMPIYWFYSTITLSFLYRPLLYNFIDDKYTRRLFFFSFPYIFLIATCSSYFSNEHTPYLPEMGTMITDGQVIHPQYYDDLYERQYENVSHAKMNVYDGLPRVRLSHYQVIDNYISLFVKYNRKYEDILEREHEIESIYKPGWNFTFFGSDHPTADDTLREAIVKEYEQIEAIIKGKRRALKDSIRQTKEDSELKTNLVTKREELWQDIESSRIDKKEELNNYEKNKREKILDLIRKQLSLSIDDVEYTDSLRSYIAVHPSTGEKGMQYIIPMRHLDSGDHTIEIELIGHMHEDESIENWNYTLPILKMN